MFLFKYVIVDGSVIHVFKMINPCTVKTLQIRQGILKTIF